MADKQADEYQPSETFPSDRIGRPSHVWEERFDKMNVDNSVLILYPEDAHQANTMRNTAIAMAKRLGYKVTTALRTEEGVLKLYIKLTN